MTKHSSHLSESQRHPQRLVPIYGGNPEARAVIATMWRDRFEATVPDLSLSPDWSQHAAASSGLDDRLHMLGLCDPSRQLAGACSFLELSERIYGLELRVKELPGNRLVVYHNQLLGVAPDTLIESVVDSSPCDLLVIPAVLKGTETVVAAERISAQRGWRLTRLAGNRSPYIAIGQTWDQYLAGKSSNFRYTLKRKQRALEKLGTVQERWYERANDITELLQCIRKVESSSWKVQAQMAITGNHQELAYYERLLPWLAGKGAMCANVLFLDMQPIAYSLCYRWAGRMGQMKTSFDERYAQASAGLIVNASAIKSAFDRGYSEFDFLGDVMPHKSHWTTTVREHENLLVYTSSPRGRLVGALKAFVARWRGRHEPVTLGRGARRPTSRVPHVAVGARLSPGV